jgi:endothelin-converting enzyme/putative endopeptidase
LENLSSLNLLRASAGLLGRSFVTENFAFYGKALTGAKEEAPRWKRCVWATDRDLQDALGTLFVEESFHEDDKQHVLQIVKEVEAAFDGVIHKADWLSPDTRTLARQTSCGYQSCGLPGALERLFHS